MKKNDLKNKEYLLKLRKYERELLSKLKKIESRNETNNSASARSSK